MERIVARERQIVIWEQWTRTAYFHQEDEWRKARKAWELVDRYTGHETAQPFKAHEKDVELWELPPSLQRCRMEKILEEHQKLHGGIGANVTGVIVACEGMEETLRKAWIRFKEGVDDEGSPVDYKKEILQFIIDLHSVVDKKFAGVLEKLGQMSASGFNSTLEVRRAIYIHLVELGAKERLRKLQPADTKLFGGKAD